MNSVVKLAKTAKALKPKLALLPEPDKNEALQVMANKLRQFEAEILEANEKDISAAKASGLNDGLIDRLRLTPERIEGIAQAIEDLIHLPDPVGQVLSGQTMKDGMQLINVRVPLGVCGIIYEARPNVTVDAATLCFKSGNVAILKGGKEAIHSNVALMKLLQAALEECGHPKEYIQLIEDTSRQATQTLMGLRDELDVLIPRGGAGLIRAVVEHAKVPVIETGTGNNHIYVDETADIEMARDILINAKTQRPSVCNAVENLLIHEAVANEVLMMVKETMGERGVELRADERSLSVLGERARPVTPQDYETEFIDLILAVKVVQNLEEALEHIQTYGTGHSEAIVTKSYDNARRFQQEVDAAAVYVNCSTRFTDGGEFGLGCEIGISTQKLHTRGPMGLEALTSNKYLISGTGQIRK